MRFFLLAALFTLVFFSSCEETVFLMVEKTPWSYENPDWASAGYLDCNGKYQSPIDIETVNVIAADHLPDLNFVHENRQYTLSHEDQNIQISSSTLSGSLNYGGTRYDFQRLHFHHNSEHRINGRFSPAEMHLEYKNAAGVQITVCRMLELGEEESPLLSTLFDQLPTLPNTQRQLESSVNLIELLEGQGSYYTYEGAQAEPPCSAGVRYILLKEPLLVREATLRKFSSLFPNNRRPLQSLNNRFILEKN
jgi:carbonic anhydrase